MRFLTILVTLLFAINASAVSFVAHGTRSPLNTAKVITIVGEINQAMEVSVEIQQRQTKDLPGARRVIIESGGGSVDSGYRIIKTLEAEHVPLVCVVLHAAHSMAFNILSHCTVRLATEDATFVVHKVAKGGIPDGVRLTALNARRLADELEKVDEPLSEYNARAMHLNMKDYSKFADAERRWTAQELLSMHYLDGYATL